MEELEKLLIYEVRDRTLNTVGEGASTEQFNAYFVPFYREEAALLINGSADLAYWEVWTIQEELLK